MNDAWVVVLAVCAIVGALVPTAIPLWAAVAVVGVALALATKVPMVVCLSVMVLCSCLATRSWAGIDAPAPDEVDGVATVVADPERRGAATTAVLRVDGRRYVTTAYGPTGARLERAQVGHSLTVTGTAVPYRGSRERRAALHAGLRLRPTDIHERGPGPVWWRAANAVRATIEDGAEPLGSDRRVLFTGLVYGDDRDQDPGTQADFRLAGLTHLLAVSGQNVAYLLIVLRPFVERGPPAQRWIATLAVLGLFACVTRFEPSVLRATAMAAIAVSARSAGRATTSLRNLALAVTGLLIVDPLLAETVAFRLSVAASAGIIVLGPTIQDRAPGPRVVRELLSVTLAAQLAVAPLLVWTFGPISIVSIPANVAAGPVAGFVMGWGMTAGVVAGLAGPLAPAIHGVTSAMLWILETIARVAAAAPVAPIGLQWIGVAIVLAASWRWLALHPVGRLATAVAVAVLCVSLVPRPATGEHQVGWSSTVQVSPAATTLMLDEPADNVALLVDLRRLGVDHVDQVVSDRPVGSALGGRITVGEVMMTGE